jgi:hypothetical protein
VIHILDKQGIRQFIADRPALFSAATNENPFATGHWLLGFIDHVAPDDWQFVVASDASDGEAAMLLYRTRAEQRRLAALANYYVSLYSPFVSTAPDSRTALRTLAQQLAQVRPAVSAITLAPLENRWADALCDPACFDRRGWYVNRYFCFGNWHLQCDGTSFERYMEARPGKLRNTWSRKLRKFDREGGRLQLVTGAPDVDAALDAYWHVYAKSWKKPEPYQTFISEWARTCAREGWLRMGIAWWQDAPIAAQFWFTMNRRAYIFKLAYDEAFAPISAGTLLTAFLVQHSLDVDRVIEIDYLTGDDGYKREWMSGRRTREGFIACNLRTVQGAAIAAREGLSGIRRRLLRRPGDPLEGARPQG